VLSGDVGVVVPFEKWLLCISVIIARVDISAFIVPPARLPTSFSVLRQVRIF